MSRKGTAIALARPVFGSVAGITALIGPAGAVFGLLYFTLGTVISGASIPLQFLPDAGLIFGQALPTGSGTTAVRDSRYFPDASQTGALIVVLVHAILGRVILLITNLPPNRTDRASEVDLRAELAG